MRALRLSAILCLLFSVSSHAVVLGYAYDSCYSPTKLCSPVSGRFVSKLQSQYWNKPRTGLPFPDLYAPSTCHKADGTPGETSVDNTGCGHKIEALFNDPNNRFIFVDMYTFFSYQLAHQLIAALVRGVSVTVMVDRDQFLEQEDKMFDYAQETGVAYATIREEFLAAGLPVYTTSGQNRGGISHNKTIDVIQAFPDGAGGVRYGAIHVTGSYNFTDNAESMNRENMVFLNSPLLLTNAVRNALAVPVEVATPSATEAIAHLFAASQTANHNVPSVMVPLLTELYSGVACASGPACDLNTISYTPPSVGTGEKHALEDFFNITAIDSTVTGEYGVGVDKKNTIVTGPYNFNLGASSVGSK